MSNYFEILPKELNITIASYLYPTNINDTPISLRSKSPKFSLLKEILAGINPACCTQCC